MRLTTLLIDDEPLARQIMREFLQAFPQIKILAECENGKQAVAAINQHQPDLIFLDVQMPVLNGFEVLERLTHTPAIIFSTAYDDFALRAFEVNAVDYLLKPYDRQRFAAAVERALERRANTSAELDRLLRLMQHVQKPEAVEERLFVRSGERIIPLLLRDLDWLEAADDYTIIHTGSAKLLSTYGLGVIEKRLHPSRFQRVHRSAIINLARLKHLEKDGEGGMLATMMSGDKIKVSRKYAAALRAGIV
ncbi:MAG: LytTR family DNA-binding domain-containing protein [candidate division KSB1 bacterium]